MSYLTQSVQSYPPPSQSWRQTGQSPQQVETRPPQTAPMPSAIMDDRRSDDGNRPEQPTAELPVALHMEISQYCTDDEEKVRALCAMTNNVNAQDCVGKTALHYAVENNRYASLNILLYERNADPSIRDCGGTTPLSLACALPMKNDSFQLSFILQLYKYGVAYGANMV